MKAAINVKCPHCGKTTDSAIWITIFPKAAKHLARENTCEKCLKLFKVQALLNIDVEKVQKWKYSG
jgi:formate dehydrogenase maturation protein FdhE